MKTSAPLIEAVLAVCFCIFVTAGIGTTATYYVATNGSDSSYGTSTEPFRTIGKGTTRLHAGDTLIIRGGTYLEPGLKIPGGSSWNAPVTIKTYPGETVIFQPTVTDGAAGVSIRGQRFIRIDGLVIDMSRVPERNGMKIHERAGDIEVLNTEVRNGGREGGSAVQVQTGSFRVVFRGCKIHDIRQIPAGGNGNHGLYWKGSNGLIENCEIYNIQGWGAHFYAAEGSNVVNDNIFRHNVLRNTGQASPRGQGAIIVSSGTRNKIYGNLIVNSNNLGIQMSKGSNEIYNNTIYGSRAWGLYIKYTASGVIAKNNIIYKNNGNILNSGSNTVLSNNFTDDPLFVDAANGDFRLKSNTPAAGLGAYELSSPTVSVPTAPASLQAAP